MQINLSKPEKILRKYQTGGEMPPQEAPVEGGAPVEQAPVGGGEQDPMVQLVQIFQQGLQSQDCQLLAQGAQMFLEIVAQAQGGGAEPAGEPVYRKGGQLLRRVRK